MTDVRALLRRTADLAADFLESLENRPVFPETSVEELRASLGGPLPDDPNDPETVVEGLAAAADAGLVGTASGRYFGFVIGGALPASLAADWLTSAWDQNAGLYVGGPSASVVEQVVREWVCDLLGLPADASIGFVTSTQMGSVTALAAARYRVLERAGWDVGRDGLAGAPRVRVLVGAKRHITIDRALRLLGLGAPEPVAADSQGRMEAAALRDAIRTVDGPTIICAQAGEVNTGAFDPFEDIADAAAEHGAWLHVDGAFGLFARLSPRTAHLADGVELADSVISDGHKWLNVPFDCGFAFIRDDAYLRAVFSAGAAYLPEVQDERPMYAFLGPELSRRARSLAVWATLRAYGRTGYRAIVERCLDNAAHLAGLVEDAEDLELLLPAPLNVVYFRYRPPGVPAEELDELNRRIAEEVLTDGRVYVGTTQWAGAVGFRPAFVNWRTTRADAELVLETVRDLGSQLVAQV